MGKVKYKDWVTKDFLIEEYHNKNKRLKQISEEFNINYQSLHEYMRKYNIKRKGRFGKNNSNYRHGMYYSEEGFEKYKTMLERDKCSLCGQTEGQIDIHHIDFNHTNDVIENLQVLCASCHSTLHRNYEWKKKRDKNKILRDEKGRFKNKNETKTNN